MSAKLLTMSALLIKYKVSRHVIKVLYMSLNFYRLKLNKNKTVFSYL